MATITAEYTKEMAAPISKEVRDHEIAMLRNLYRYDDAAVRKELAELPSSRAWRPNMMLMHFNEKTGRFVNPLEVEAAFDTSPASCKLDAELVSLHVDDVIDRLDLSEQQPLEHRLFTEAPITVGKHRDWATWIVSSAVDRFMEKGRQGRDKRLQPFVAGSVPTQALAEDDAIQIEDGRVNLSQGLWAHHQPNMFARFFGPVSKAFTKPLLHAAGIPVLVRDTFGFVNKLIQDYTNDAGLQPLWQTRRLDFTIARDVPQDFRLRDGYWAVVDTDYVQRNQDLEGHAVDLDQETFEIMDRNGKPIAAPYLVTRFSLAPTKK